MKLKIIEVWWLDAYSRAGWFGYDKKTHHKEVNLVPTFGIEVDHTDEWLILAFGYNKDAGDFVGEFSIPNGMVRKKRVIKIVEV